MTRVTCFHPLSLQSSHSSPAQETATAPHGLWIQSKLQRLSQGLCHHLPLLHSPPLSPATPTNSLSSFMGHLVLSLRLHLHWASACNSPFLPPSVLCFLLQGPAKCLHFREAFLDPPTWIFSWSELPQHQSQTSPWQHSMGVCVLVGSRMVRKELSSLPVSLMLPDGVSPLRTEIRV